jgi:OOP family OmpA-OmpF porin
VGFVSQLSDQLALDLNLGYNVALSDHVNGHTGSSEDDSYYRDIPELASWEQAKLDATAKTMRENPDIKVAVSGNTDSTDSRSLNEKLADVRVNVVQSYLMRKGISGEKLPANGYAFDKPAPNSTVQGRHLNRRTELEIVE